MAPPGGGPQTSDEGSRPHPVPEVGPEHVALVEALGKLDLPHRTVVVLYYLADKTVADISRELDIPVGTVKTRLARSRERLAPLLSEPEESDHV